MLFLERANLARHAGDGARHYDSRGAAVVLPTPPTVAAIAAGTPDEEVLRQLRARPLWLPAMPVGAACPADESRPWSTPIVGQLHGEGPMYILESGVDRGPRAIWRYGDRGAIKIVWQQEPAAEGPALVRGRRLDGAEALRFDEGAYDMVFPRGGTAEDPAPRRAGKTARHSSTSPPPAAMPSRSTAPTSPP